MSDRAMSDRENIPVLTDLIESGIEIKMSDLGLDDNLEIENEETYSDATEIEISALKPEPSDPFEDNPALEQTVRHILDEHMELAWQEIRLAIQRHLNK
ncbi:MAG: hypothetical protein GY935_21865 [Gammaproteobacteria bacterium]|nr:hypothetical protein [Gammaproteobacteria bacterium]